MTSIEWVTLGDGKRGRTVNPIKARDKKTGAVGHFCERVSPGCAHCYASTWQARFNMHPFEPQYRKRIEFFLDPEVLSSVIRRKVPTAFFWEDMSDLFGAWVTDRWLDTCFATMAATSRHLHMVLTKRPERQRAYLEGLAALSPAARAQRFHLAATGRGATTPTWRFLAEHFKAIEAVEMPLFRVMHGTSYENQPTADARLPELLKTPAWQRFVSFEPALGPVTVRWAACTCADKAAAFKTGHQADCALREHELCALLHRVIYGGESGAGARPNYLQWARSTIRQCNDLRIPAFVKQLGAFPTTTPIGTVEFEKHPMKVVKLQLVPADGRTRPKRKGNDPAEWPEEYRVREL